MGLFDLLSDIFSDKLGDWMETASDAELRDAYDKDRTTEYKETGVKTPKMNRIEKEMSKRYMEEYNKNHTDSENTQHERWTDKNRWE